MAKKATSFDVKAWRQRVGLTQLEACALLVVSPRTITRWECKDPAKRTRPWAWLIAKMKQMERNRLAGLPLKPERIPEVPLVRRKLPKPSIRTGDPKHIDIAPMSL